MRKVTWLCAVLALLFGCQSGSTPPNTKPAQPGASTPAPEATAGLVPLGLELPRPVFIGTPPKPPQGTNLEPKRDGPRPPLMVPRGIANVAAGKPVTCSDREPMVGEAQMVTDGDKEAGGGSYMELAPGLQYAQVDLGAPCEVFAVAFWLYHGEARVWHDVVVQVADDGDFISNVKTLFNNDHDNSSGLGLGSDYEFYETYQGKLIPAGGVKARYVRVYTKGNTTDEMNRFTEIEVHGRPAK